MKIDRKDVDYMRAAIAPLDTDAVRHNYLTGNYPRADLTQDVDKRYRWDLCHAAGLTPWICDLYRRAEVHNSHIDTALRSIVRPL